MDITILNNGAKPGTIVDLRFSFLSEKLSFALFPEYTIDVEKWNSAERIGKFASSPHEVRKRFERSAWSGVILAKGASDASHMMFQTNSAGFRDMPSGDFQVILEYTTSASAPWIRVCDYQFTFDNWSRTELAKGAGFIFGVSQADRAWPKDWKDEDQLLLDEEVEGKLGVSEPGA